MKSIFAALAAAILLSATACRAGTSAPATSVAQATSAGGAAATSTNSGLRLFTIAHSFHLWLPGALSEVEATAGLKHVQLGSSVIGGSRVIQHWNLEDDKHQAKTVLATGRVDLLTMSPMLSPDEGIEKFTQLALEKNPRTRILVQEFWLPVDRLDSYGEKSYGDLATQLRPWRDPPPDPADPLKGAGHFDLPTAEQVRKLHEPYFKKMDEYLARLNKEAGHGQVFVVPVGQAVVALRAKVLAGQAPGLVKQSQLFTDGSGHPAFAIQTLAAYCFYAVIYHKSPVGLGLPARMVKAKADPKLNQLLQELAWAAVTEHPQSGVKAPPLVPEK